MKTIKTDMRPPASKQQLIRPMTFDDYIGQETIKKNLTTSIKASKIRKEALGHILLYGPPGLGKTTLAAIVAKEMEGSLKTVTGPNIERPGEMAAILSNLQEGDFLFIDEIHRLPKPVEEILYSAMEDYKIDILIGEGSQMKTIKIELSQFTLIGATTKVGMVSGPLRDRFQMAFPMEYYTSEELISIIRRTGSLYGMELTREEAALLAAVSRETPRIANNTTKRVADYLLANHQRPCITGIEKALMEMSLDEKGFNPLDRKYITCLKKADGRPVGLKTLSAYLGENTDTITENIEPYLLRKGYIGITARGRILQLEEDI